MPAMPDGAPPSLDEITAASTLLGELRTALAEIAGTGVSVPAIVLMSASPAHEAMKLDQPTR
jgi:hypothetical protein